MYSNDTTVGAPPVERSRAITSSVLAVLFGVFLIFGAALAQPNAIHNAAHDARHSLAFPCH